MSQTKLQFTLALLSFLIVGLVTDAHAQLTGSTVNVSAFYPDTSSVYTNFGNRVVSDTVEYPSLAPYATVGSFDITGTQLIFKLGFADQFGPNVTFNGYIFSIISGLSISGASVNSASAFSPVSITIDNGNRLLVNYVGVFHPSGSSIIELSLVPEPPSFGMFGLGLILTAWSCRCRMRGAKENPADQIG
jgi:hypothetical protein